MSDAMYYDKPVLLNRDKHRQRRIRPSPGFGFARKANSLFLAAAEFEELKANLPGSTAMLVPTSGHYVQEEAPAETAVAMHGFADRVMPL